GVPRELWCGQSWMVASMVRWRDWLMLSDLAPCPIRSKLPMIMVWRREARPGWLGHRYDHCEYCGWREGGASMGLMEAMRHARRGALLVPAMALAVVAVPLAGCGSSGSSSS